ncbi:iron-sulfur cluster-binding protein [Desulfosarcina widdelii]|uniref:Iron-sulfur cluster-binding protein n=1 Tax=Desulfosarcina widdelii TaxID=947919 RepID=A0A5K7Z5M3_9BACT|nr:LutB/LldF family L-lactate oxidation iron-sulfur protein [Desulfosarcina widdelii]BBO77086.1 iron-sulfur cluster-binding protein [Desulfosarcina widdelii]
MDAKTRFDFKSNIEGALKDDQLRKNLRNAMDILVDKRRTVFTDNDELERLRAAGNAIKRRALKQLPQLLEQLEEKCTQNGIQVHWAEDTDQANGIVLDLLHRHDATSVVKGKSMVSEEMHLNRFLEKNGIEAVETDLGEFIIQLNHETPSHIIVPAIHKNKDEVAAIFHEKLADTPYTEDVEELTAIARQALRKRFAGATVGLSGVNFAIAETGTLLLVENEGNGRMCTTAPDVHIAVMGLEKVVEKLSDVPPLLRLLTGSATGQIVTTYVNMITSPRKKGEKDGPKEVHLVILDNGRASILADPQLRQTLLCIRCGTCLNHCPVYVRIGGHAYGHVYPGPIGKILTPQMEGLERTGVLVTASSLCGACGEVCPVKIPIPDLIRRLRNESYDQEKAAVVPGGGYKKNLAETMVWKGWELANRLPVLNEMGTRLAGAMGKHLPKVGPLKQWTSIRTAPRVARSSLHERVRNEGVKNE